MEEGSMEEEMVDFLFFVLLLPFSLLRLWPNLNKAENMWQV